MAGISKVYYDAELGVLGSLLLDAPACAAEMMLTLTPEDFATPACRTLFEAARALYHDDSAIDPITVEARAGESYRGLVRDILELTPTAANWRAYVQALRRQSMLHRVSEIAGDIATSAAIEAEPDALQARAEELLTVLAGNSSRKLVHSMNDLLAGFFSRQGKKRVYLDWGFDMLNAHLFCEQGGGDYVLLAARPSVGKSALALQLGVHFARQGKRVDFYSLETEQDKAADRIMSAQSMVSFRAIKRDEITGEQMRELVGAKKRLVDLPFNLIDAAGMTVENIRAHALRNQAEIVIIDYLQLVDHKNRRLSEYDRVSEVSRGIQRLCKQYGITVIALSQLSRIGDAEEPELTHLRSSGQLEQDADAVLFLYRPPYDPIENQEERDDAENRRILKIAKNKEGRVGKIKMWFTGDIQWFSQQWRDFYKHPVQQASEADCGLGDPKQTRQLRFDEGEEQA